MIVATEHPYIVCNNEILKGEPVIKGTRTPVRAIVEWWKFGASPEEILENLPHLTLSQIFDALSYYVDHRDEIEQYIAENIVEGKNHNLSADKLWFFPVS